MAEETKPEEVQAAAAPAEAPAPDAVQVEEPQLQELPETAPAAGGGQIDILLETAMPVSVRVGEIDMSVKHLLQLGPGSVVALNKALGEPVDLFLRGIRFASGNLVVVNNQIGVRIKEILASPK